MPSEQQSTAETWWVTVNPSDSGRQRLHTSRECHHAPAEIQEATESQIDALDKCTYCSGKTDSGDNYREEECWKCGETFGNLPIHIRSCNNE